MLTALLVAAALLAGLAGGWSPCGLSMVETLAAARGAGERALGAVAFVAGAAAGGVATFGGLALAGRELAAGGPAWTAAAAVALAAASVGDGAGRRIVPQVRRQVPESWRRRAPLPLASAAYGVLLGLAFTTFVLSFATYALAAAALALGDPALGATVGLAFAAGRAIPVLAVTPWPASPIAAAMAERPAILRGLRTVAAAGLAGAAVALALGAAPARAADFLTPDGADPVAAGGEMVWQAAGGGIVFHAGRTDVLPGADPAISPTYVAWHDDATITIARRDTLAPVARVLTTGVEELALSDRWIAFSTTGADGVPQILAAEFLRPDAAVVTAAVSAGLGRPAIDGDLLAFHVTGSKSSRIITHDLATGVRTTLRRAVGASLLNPSVSGGRLAYVRSSPTRQQLMVGSVTPGYVIDAEAWSTTPTVRRDAGREPGRHDHRTGYPGRRHPPAPPRPPRGLTVTLWTTALDGSFAYVTYLRHLPGGAVQASIVRAALPVSRRG